MAQSLQISAANIDPALLELPWELPLKDWPSELIVALPRGISRHVVRFVSLSGRIISLKENVEEAARHEYNTLRELRRLGAPCVAPSAMIVGRKDIRGEPLPAVLATQHLHFSLSYRALFSHEMHNEMTGRLLDSLSILLVRLHLLGFFWGDVSLSNTLFRRDADTFSAYLVDAETGKIHPQLSSGERKYDLEIAKTNIIGELLDLQAANLFSSAEDPARIGERLCERYEELWRELTAAESIDASQKWRVARRIERLENLGFDVEEIQLSTDADGTHLFLQPKIVDTGHFHRQLMHLIGMDAEEKQAQRMINDIHAYTASSGQSGDPIEVVAHRWVTDVFEPLISSVPAELRHKLEPAQIFHEYLDHRWFFAEQQGHDVSQEEAIESYITSVLAEKPDEKIFIETVDENSVEL